MIPNHTFLFIFLHCLYLFHFCSFILFCICFVSSIFTFITVIAYLHLVHLYIHLLLSCNSALMSFLSFLQFLQFHCTSLRSMLLYCSLFISALNLSYLIFLTVLLPLLYVLHLPYDHIQINEAYCGPPKKQIPA